MDQPPDRRFPEPWHDPEFSAPRGGTQKPTDRNAQGVEGGDGDGDRRVSRRRRMSGWAVGIVGLPITAGLVLNPTVGPLIVGALALFAMVLLLVAGAMALGVMGMGLFAVGDRIIVWLRQGSRWPEK